MEPAPVLAALCPASASPEPVEFALLAGGLSGAHVVVAVVIGRAARRTGAAARAAEAMWCAGARGADVLVIEDDTPARGIARALDDLQPSLVALGPRRGDPRGAARLGTTSRRVVHVSSCPVAVVPGGYHRPAAGVRAVGAGIAPTAEGWSALQAAAALARAGGGRLRPIEALDPAPADTLVTASAELDLLVLGSRASGPPGAVRLGRVSRAVVDRAACPVLLLPHTARIPVALTPIG